ncbi:universal stress protein [Hamadaea sp.]|uniref:universal stress protein n=1 Tax=Hamadaea sp. TaxID=2024425 RepID=UPI0025C63921|nr:universal stress protein [Hamadaea sp.]
MYATRPVVVGVDGSPSSLAAVAFAARDAVWRGVPLRLVYAHESPLYGYLPVGMVSYSIAEAEHFQEQVAKLLADTVERIQRQYPALTAVESKEIAGVPAGVLIEESRKAALTVVGSRGVGGFTELLLGSVSAQVAAHAHGPVVVVRPPESDVEPGPEQPPPSAGPEAPVLVGYDESVAARAALVFAVDEARRRDAPLIVMNACVPSEQTDAAKMLANAVAAYAEGGITVQTRVKVTGNVEKAMVDASADAALTVVGCRGRGGFAGLLLGSVSRALVHHAHHPVAVIHPSED